MKISGYGETGSITFSSGRDIGQLLKGIAPGDHINARIISREGNIALLDIAGKRIRAEFTGGIPGSSIVPLVLAEKNRSTAVFRMLPGNPEVELPEFLLRSFMVRGNINDRNFISELYRFMGQSSKNMMEINLFLSGIKKDKINNRKITDLFNRMFFGNMPGQTLNDLLLIAALRLPSPLFSALLMIMERTGGKSGLLDGQSQTDEIIDDIRNTQDDETLQELVRLLTETFENSEEYGEFPLPVNEGFSKLEYITSENSCFISFSLSALGRIDVYVKTDNNITVINIGSANEETLSMLEEQSGDLKNSLTANGLLNVMLDFFNSKKMIDKLCMLCADFHKKSGFDIKA